MVRAGRRARTLLLAAFFGAAATVTVVGDVGGFSGGIDEQGAAAGGAGATLLESGCSCHNPQYTGTVRAVLEGVPAFHTFNGERAAGPFNLTVRIVGGPEPGGSNAGGFHLQVLGEDPGRLEVPEGAEDVQVRNGQATHTSAGNDQRTWTVRWVPPAAGGSDVLFVLTVNAVNGNGAPDPGDAWGRATYVALGANRAGGATAAAEPLPWLGAGLLVGLLGGLAGSYLLLRQRRGSP